MMKIIFHLIIFSFLSLNANSQSTKTIEDLSDKFQKKLDTGVDMLGTTFQFYLQMDSMLNLVYNNLRSELNISQKNKLKKEQLYWLQKRNIFFKKENENFKRHCKKDKWGPDMEMVTYGNKAEFIKKRILVLLHKANYNFNKLSNLFLYNSNSAKL